MPTATPTAPNRTSSLRDRVNELNQFMATGRIIDAMNEFYDPNVTMQENAKAPTVGLAANIEREKQFLSFVKDWKGYAVKSLAVGDEVSFIESTIDFISIEDQPVHMEQVSVARWKNGRIVSERFYYDSAK